MQIGLPILVADSSGSNPESFMEQKMALVLGNEGQGVEVPEGISYKTVSLAMTGPMESLNVAVAGSILLYIYQEGQ